MKRSNGLLLLASVLCAMRCTSAPPDLPRACDPIPNVDPQNVTGLDPDVVWGFADLHAHPAIERAFGGRLIWGSARDDAPIDATQLPLIASCPVETHDPSVTSPVDRAVGALVFPELGAASGFAHGPIGTAGEAWPNARDLIHQAMNVASIRRAYEGGLRLMFASTTDDQVITALLQGPNVYDAFVPDPGADYRSARAQIDLIEQIADENSTWMAIARTPKEARRIIASGRLALVLSLEMQGLREADVFRLVDDYGVAHVIPIHLIDNDIGGTAANGDIFNTASAEVSAIYRTDKKPRMYMDLAWTPLYARPLGWPLQIGTLSPPIYAKPIAVPFDLYAPNVCYDATDACAAATPTTSTYVQLGQENARGLCSQRDECDAMPGAARIQHLMEKGLIIDVSHMSRRSTRETIALSSSYPFIASHSDIAHLCEGGAQPSCTDPTTILPSTERSLESDQARKIITQHGVLGLGTPMATFARRTLFASRGGPLFVLSPSSPFASAQNGTALVSDPTAPLSKLTITTNGGVTSSNVAQPFVRVEMRSHVFDDAYRFQRREYVVPMGCSDGACSATVDLGTRDVPIDPSYDTTSARDVTCTGLTCTETSSCGSGAYTVDDIESVQLEWLYLAGSGDLQCQSTGSKGGPSWTIENASIAGDGGSIATVGASPLATLDGDRGQLVIYDRQDRPEVTPKVMSGHLLRVAMAMSPKTELEGPSPSDTGVDVCVAFRETRNGACTSVAPPITASACPNDGTWWTINQRGGWASSIELFTFARHSGDDTAICGLDVATPGWTSGAPVAIDRVTIDEIEDPLGRFVRRYADITREVAGNQYGAVAIGTDFNGLNGLIDIAELETPFGTALPSSCSLTPSHAPAALAPMRIRRSDGSLGGEVLLEERGLATYGLLADMLAYVRAYPGCGPAVYDSLMLSAEATLRAWEWIVDPTTAASHHALPTAPGIFECPTIPGVP